MHITASVFINDDESGLHHDYEAWLEKLAPEKPHSQYQHNGSEDNADAHLKRTIMGREVVVAITAGRPRLRPVGADFLRGIRRHAAQAGAGQDHWGVSNPEHTLRILSPFGECFKTGFFSSGGNLLFNSIIYSLIGFSSFPAGSLSSSFSSGRSADAIP